MSTVADKLDEARALIERGWCQGPFATDASGKDVSPRSPGAVCFCALGATWRIDFGDIMLDRFLKKAIGDQDVGSWNDAPERTQTEVIDAFKRAAELARAGEQ